MRHPARANAPQRRIGTERAVGGREDLVDVLERHRGVKQIVLSGAQSKEGGIVLTALHATQPQDEFSRWSVRLELVLIVELTVGLNCTSIGAHH